MHGNLLFMMSSSSCVCIMCLNNDENTIIELSMSVQANLFYNYVKYLLPEYIVPDQKLPLYICTSCSDSLTSFYKFKKMCLFNNTNTTSTRYTNTDDIKTKKEIKFIELNELSPIKIPNQDPKNKEIYSSLQKVNNSYHVDQKEEINQTIPKIEFVENDNNVTSAISGNNKHGCPICHKLVKEKYLKDHLKIHTMVKDYDCPTCMKRFASRCKLTLHKRTHEIVKTYECPVCLKKFLMKRVLEHHMVGHSDKKLFHCRFCERVFLREINLKVHEKIHLGIKELTCYKCGKKFMEMFAFRRHLFVHKENECSVCHCSFVRKSALIRHFQSHMTSNEL